MAEYGYLVQISKDFETDIGPEAAENFRWESFVNWCERGNIVVNGEVAWERADLDEPQWTHLWPHDLDENDEPLDTTYPPNAWLYRATFDA